MKRKVRKQGCSLMVGLTPTAIEMLKLKEGDFVDITVKNNKLEIIKIKKGEGESKQ